MAYIGRPPYTEEQIAAMTSKEEKLRAIAEYKSYNLRLKREVEAQASRSNGPSKYRNSHEPAHSHRRSGYGNESRGHGSYHPYHRLQPQFKNKTAIFNQPCPEGSETNKAVTYSADNKTLSSSRNERPEPTTLCPALTSTGVCTRRGCQYRHDPNQQALCKRWLYKNDCPEGDFCSLSHVATRANAPTCLHFQRDRCNNKDCRFAHVRIDPAARNCEAFGRMGYCEKGNACTELHAHECPSFSNTGVCSYGDKCRLGHVHRASRMRQTTRPSSEASDHPEDDLDTAEDEQTWMPPCKQPTTSMPQQFTHQADFVPLDADD